MQSPGTAPFACGVLAGDEAVRLPVVEVVAVEVVALVESPPPPFPEQPARAAIDTATSNTVRTARNRRRDTPGRIMATNVAIPAWHATFLSPVE
ncbi:hypothetical protein [Gordonia polyisoprenivorans]|uniref:hypothetical protein n=1 Tax=Gordonia polyisoprenivorans TaxID=84595 RepID=UPI0030CFC802